MSTKIRGGSCLKELTFQETNNKLAEGEFGQVDELHKSEQKMIREMKNPRSSKGSGRSTVYYVSMYITKFQVTKQTLIKRACDMEKNKNIIIIKKKNAKL